uniref:E2F transcription factor CC-MB domain-containing protein n=1 Tax=Anabas testudineus TaxID=64144 RepID=A0A3Q1H2Q0_ANATE
MQLWTGTNVCDFFFGHVSSGQTLLAVRAPSGTQLDVPIPKAVQDSPVKYQVHLKSISGPIDVVLLSKRSVSSDPVVLPVPPPDEMLQNAKLAMSASDETENGSAQCPASADFFSPLLHLSPPSSKHEFVYNLDDSEGLCDLYDVPVLNV